MILCVALFSLTFIYYRKPNIQIWILILYTLINILLFILISTLSNPTSHTPILLLTTAIINGEMKDNINNEYYLLSIIVLLISLVYLCIITRKTKISLIRDLIICLVITVLLPNLFISNNDPVWSNLSLWKKFANGYDNFFLPTFINSPVPLVLFSSSLILLVLSSTKKNINKIEKVFFLSINGISIFLAFTCLFIDLPWYVHYIFWPICILNSFICLIKLSNNKVALLYYLVAGLSLFFGCFTPMLSTFAHSTAIYFTTMSANLLLNEVQTH